MTVDDELVRAAERLVASRFGAKPWSGAAAMRLEDGSVVTSTAPDTVNGATSLCHETGALCEAFKLNKRVVASVCVVQRETGEFQVLTPCGVCQERLFLYGGDTAVAVPTSSGWESRRLDEVQPHYWRTALTTE